jgi:hypothetical protein
VNPSRGKFKGIIIHHSATVDGNTYSWGAIKRYHKVTKGWDDIGYHFGIERINGETVMLTGRGLEWQGAHCLGHNDTIGICVVGNYDLVPPSSDKVGLLLRLISGLLEMFPDLKPDDVRYHRDFAPKTCPGNYFVEREFLVAGLKKMRGNRGTIRT